MSTPDRQRLRDAFHKPTYLPVRVTPRGFEVAEEHHYDELQGRIIKISLIRKLFDDGSLLCSSSDGVRAENGTLCQTCLHPSCQPKLRLHLALDKIVYVLELAATSAENLFALEDQAEAEGIRLIDCTVRLRAIDRRTWGEVTFERIPQPDPTS